MTENRFIAPSRKHAGEWIAWNKNESKIIAHGRTFSEVVSAAERLGESDPMFEKVPRRLFGGVGLSLVMASAFKYESSEQLGEGA